MNTPEANPVGRLLLLLREFWNSADTLTNARVLGGYLGIEMVPSPQMYLALTALVNLPGEARAAFGRANLADSMPFDEPMQELDKAQAAVLEMVNLQNSCGAVKRLIDAGTLMALTFVSRNVGTVESDAPLNEDQLDEIRTAAEALIKSVRMAEDLPGSVKRTLIEHAEAVLHALHVVGLTGAEALTQERDRLEGHVRRQPAGFIEALRHSTVGAAFVGLTLLLSSVSGTVHEALQLTQDVEHIYKIVGPRAHEKPENTGPGAIGAPADDATDEEKSPASTPTGGGVAPAPAAPE